MVFVCSKSIYSQFYQDTLLLGSSFKKNFNYEIAVLNGDYKKAFWKDFQDSKSEFDDKEIIQRLNITMQTERKKILSTHYLMNYNFKLDTYDFKKKQFKCKHYSKYWNDSLVYFSSGNEWYYNRKYAKYLNSEVEISSSFRSDILFQYVKVGDLDSAKRIAEVRSFYENFDNAYQGYPLYLLNFTFSESNYLIFGRKKPLLIPRKVIVINRQLNEILSIPFFSLSEK